jgi:hypothetical protein
MDKIDEKEVVLFLINFMKKSKSLIFYSFSVDFFFSFFNATLKSDLLNFFIFLSNIDNHQLSTNFDFLSYC